jgi:hypothetical protein
MSVINYIVGIVAFQALLLAAMFFIYHTAQPKGKHNMLLFIMLLFYLAGMAFIPLGSVYNDECNTLVHKIGTGYNVSQNCTGATDTLRANFIAYYRIIMTVFFFYLGGYVLYELVGKRIWTWINGRYR